MVHIHEEVVEMDRVREAGGKADDHGVVEVEAHGGLVGVVEVRDDQEGPGMGHDG